MGGGMQRLVFRLYVCALGKPSGGGEREPPSVCMCVVANEPSAVSHGNGGRSASEHK